ncbi:MAG: response regulator, partial [Lachnospiraceae bacterium]|nr:response regulator [Lachnospiraceae bacterium]
ITGMLASWFLHIKQYRDYRFRAFFTSCMAWMNFTIYGVFSEDLFGILSTMCAMVVLLGIYCIYETVYIAVGISVLLLLYHGFFLSDIHITLSKDGTRMILQILSVFVTEYITYYLVRQQEESNKRLLDTIEDLKRAEQSKNDFMANVSHEIRTPINTICGISEVVMHEELEDKVRRDIFDIQAAGRNLLSVVSDILDFSELEAGEMELVEEPYNITSTINDIMNMAIAKNGEKDLEMIVDCDASIPSSLLGDEQKIRRIIMNIVDNAIKFTKDGGIVIEISSREEAYGINLSVTVKDTGIGMNEENIENLFTSFNQVDTKRNRQEGGIGLGLAIAQAIVEKMGGFITVRSAPDKGSEIQFVIPQKVLDKAAIVSVKNSETIRVAGYIDMEKYNYALIREGYAASIQHMVEQLGFYYRYCKNLQELKRRIEKEKFTHVFVSFDEYLEDKQYFEELSEHLKVIVVQGRKNEEELGGRILHVYKPFYVLSVASVLNGEHIVQSMDGSHYQNRRFIAPAASVLVVDDNIMNLRVVEGLLRPYQIKVFVAGSGKEALSKIENMGFDFVFMDHMMPEMDGVETLHRIRQKPGQYFKNVPIIALTANAIGGAREMFLSEGFSDFVAKPIETSVLERVLRRHIPEEKIIKVEDAEIRNIDHAEAADGERKAPVREDDKVIRMEGIDVTTGLGFSGGDMKDYVEIVQVYYTSGLVKFKEIQKAYGNKDWKNYAIQVHSLKSMSMGIGAVKLSDMAKELEAAGKAKKEDYIFAHNEEMLTE